jgi:aminoglycoside/choline kinase family phosphotransferase
MRIGPAVYDLASFLYDPYVKLRSERERAALCEVYGNATGRADISAVLPFAAVERLIQCLGAFGRLVSVGQPQFTKWVLPALENLLAAADEAELEAVGALAEELISAECRPREHHHHHGRECECGCGHSSK